MICWPQCQPKMWGPLFRRQEKSILNAHEKLVFFHRLFNLLLFYLLFRVIFSKETINILNESMLFIVSIMLVSNANIKALNIYAESPKLHSSCYMAPSRLIEARDASKTQKI